ncbi:MAG: single-stranded-DNA-specific exonuclease RecJ [Phycisphaera sp.]|nr:single-stranded-DNA-specific exonuclease RecJ [Phycisphaera sp.]
MDARAASSSEIPSQGTTPLPAEPIELDIGSESDASALRGLLSRWHVRATTGAGPASSGRGLLDRVVAARASARPIPMDEVTFGHLERPDRLSGAVEAASRLSQAIDEGRRIVIHGDYDFDGVASSSILCRVIRVIAPDHPVEVVLPDRYETGYGLSTQGLVAMRERGVDLVIAVDCGITAHDAIAAGNAVGLETMVLDHHTIPRTEDGSFDLPAASVVVHPHLPVSPGEAETDREACGAAIAFKVAWALATTRYGEAGSPAVVKQELMEATILAGLGTIADVMPLVAENRALAILALRMLTKSGLPGLQALLDVSGHDSDLGTVHEETVQFQLAPRVNALGRLGSAMPAVELLCDSDPARARVLATAIDAANERRREEERRIVAEAAERVEAEGQSAPDHPVIVLADPGWRRGLVGPACARLSERFGRPVLLMEAGEDGLARGSARSTPDYSIHDGLLAVEHLLERFGGHAAAAGFTLQSERVDDLRLALVEHARSTMKSDRELVSTVDIDIEADVDELVEVENLQRLRLLAPFGQGHPKPVVLLRRVRPIEIRWVGGNKDTLQLQMAGPGRRILKAVWFRVGDHRAAIEAALQAGPVDIVGSPDIDRWRGREQPKLMIKDLRASDG